MSAKINYEIHGMRGGRWVTVGIYQDKDDALRDARGAMRKRYLAIRVIEEIFDPECERFVTRTIFRDQVDTGSATAGTSSSPAPAPAPARRRTAARHGGSADGTLSSAALGLVGMSSVLLVGIFGLFWFGFV